MRTWASEATRLGKALAKRCAQLAFAPLAWWALLRVFEARARSLPHRALENPLEDLAIAAALLAAVWIAGRASSALRTPATIAAVSSLVALPALHLSTLAWMSTRVVLSGAEFTTCVYFGPQLDFWQLLPRPWHDPAFRFVDAVAFAVTAAVACVFAALIVVATQRRAVRLLTITSLWLGAFFALSMATRELETKPPFEHWMREFREVDRVALDRIPVGPFGEDHEFVGVRLSDGRLVWKPRPGEIRRFEQPVAITNALGNERWQWPRSSMLECRGATTLVVRQREFPPTRFATCERPGQTGTALAAATHDAWATWIRADVAGLCSLPSAWIRRGWLALGAGVCAQCAAETIRARWRRPRRPTRAPENRTRQRQHPYRAQPVNSAEKRETAPTKSAAALDQWVLTALVLHAIAPVLLGLLTAHNASLL